MSHICNIHGHNIVPYPDLGTEACKVCGMSKKEIENERTSRTDDSKTGNRSRGVGVSVGVIAVVAVVGFIFFGDEIFEIGIPNIPIFEITPAEPEPQVAPVPTEPDSTSGLDPDTAAIQVDDLQSIVSSSGNAILDAINDIRANRDLEPVALGNRGAAQAHAEDMQDGCFVSHWGTNGLKPYMRHSLAGGYRAGEEIAFNTFECIGGAPAKGSLVEAAVSNSQHMTVVLDPRNEMVDIGTAGNETLVLYFERSSVEFSETPSIENGILSFDMASEEFDNYVVSLHYDAPPVDLTSGQLSYTECYDDGRPIASIKPPNAGSVPESRTQVSTVPKCANPAEYPPRLPAPVSPDDASRKQQTARHAGTTISYLVPWVTAYAWDMDGGSFKVDVNVSGMLAQHGDGVYTVRISGWLDGTLYPASEYSVFHGISEP